MHIERVGLAFAENDVLQILLSQIVLSRSTFIQWPTTLIDCYSSKQNKLEHNYDTPVFINYCTTAARAHNDHPTLRIRFDLLNASGDIETLSFFAVFYRSAKPIADSIRNRLEQSLRLVSNEMRVLAKTDPNNGLFELLFF